MTDKDKRFVDEYLVDFDAKNAAIRAGYAVATARNASAWITPEHPAKPQLRELIDRKMAALSRRCGISAERVLQEIATIAFSNFEDAVDPQTGRIRKDAERIDLAAVAGIHVRFGDNAEYDVRMYDKLRALELLGKRLNLFADNIEINGSVPVIVDDTQASA